MMRDLRRLTIGLTLAMVSPGPASAQESPPCAAPEHRQFDFWLGEWRVRTPDGQDAGVNTVRSLLNGCVLEESWRGTGGSIGRSFNMYYERDRRWHQTWVDGSGGRLDLAGGLDRDGRMVLRGEMPGPNGGTVLHEISWQPLDAGKVRQHWRASRDGGATWRDVFVGIYHPAGAASPAPGDN